MAKKLALIGSAFAVLSLSVSAASQVYNGDLVQIAVGDGGSLSISDSSCTGTAPISAGGGWTATNACGIHVKSPTASAAGDPYVIQYLSWGSVVHFDDGASTLKYQSPFSATSATTFTPVSNTTNLVAGGGNVVSVADLGSTGLRWTQTISHVTGTRYVLKRWVLQNTHATKTYTNLKFFHGGDTYFGGEDTAYGFYDAGSGAVYLRNSSFATWGVMRYFGTPSTPANRYYEGNYSSVWSNIDGGTLPNTVDASFHDAGYALQWNRVSLAPGESWTIDAMESWSDSGAVQVLPPAPQTVSAGSTVDLAFNVQNLTAGTISAALSAAASNGWAATLLTTSPQSITANGSAGVTIRVTVPAGAAPSSTSAITLTANDGTTNYSAAVNLTVQAAVGPWTPPRNIPTLSEWGMIIMAALMAIATFVTLRRQRR